MANGGNINGSINNHRRLAAAAKAASASMAKNKLWRRKPSAKNGGNISEWAMAAYHQ